MNTIPFRKNRTSYIPREITVSTPKGLIDRYQDYKLAQEHLRVYWLMKAIIIIPCAVMVPTITLMHHTSPNFLWFVALSMLIFFANIIVHIAELKSTVYVTVYHISILAMILIPTINYLFHL